MQNFFLTISTADDRSVIIEACEKKFDHFYFLPLRAEILRKGRLRLYVGARVRYISPLHEVTGTYSVGFDKPAFPGDSLERILHQRKVMGGCLERGLPHVGFTRCGRYAGTIIVIFFFFFVCNYFIRFYKFLCFAIGFLILYLPISDSGSQQAQAFPTARHDSRGEPDVFGASTRRFISEYLRTHSQASRLHLHY